MSKDWFNEEQKLEIYDWQEHTQSVGLRTTTSGNVKVIPNFYIPQLHTHRRVWIYLPPDYEESEQHYPVLYMFDGQNLFDAHTSYSGEWGVDKTLDELYEHGMHSGAIVVGIDNGREKRMQEYVPSKKGRFYASFIVNNLKPFIDDNFRTLPSREHTGIAGSSLGGLMALYMARKYSCIFSKIGAFSPAMAFGTKNFNHMKKREDMKIYFDVGTAEALPYQSAKEYADEVWNIYYKFICAGFSHDELLLYLDRNAGHNEPAWRKRFTDAFLWLFEEEYD